jgi:hypothetical protein
MQYGIMAFVVLLAVDQHVDIRWPDPAFLILLSASWWRWPCRSG